MKKYKFTIHGSEFAVRVRKVEGDQVQLEVNGTPYDVIFQREAQPSKTPVVIVRKDINTKAGNERVKENFKPVEESKRPSAKIIKSPLPGNIIKVNVNEGDVIKEGDVLMIMESMKMENNILAEHDGKIVKVVAPAGKVVLQDEVLFEIE